MLNVVIDTNVIISSAKTPNGKPDKVFNAVIDRQDLCWIYSVDILAEYADVLSRPKHKFSIEKQNFYINSVKDLGELIVVAHSVIPIKDESDRCFYDAAVVGKAILITGNGKHFPAEDFIMSPAEFIERYL